VGNQIQWAFAGGVEAVFANELAETTERTISLDKQVPIQQRLTVRVRISNQALENSAYDLQAYIVRQVADSIRKKVNWAMASTTKATEVFYGPFAQDAESGTYGQEGYVPGKQTGTYSTFSKETAAEMIGKLAARNLDTDNVAFVMGAEDFWKLKVTPFDQGSGIMLIGNDNRLLGIPVVVNNAINRSTEKGAISGHNIGLGNFKYVPTMQHGNIRLSVDAGSAVASGTDEVITTINADFSLTILKDGADAFVLYTKS
jgi:HK97 family phage major capsid protein